MEAPELPAWVLGLFKERDGAGAGDGGPVRVREASGATLASTTIESAAGLDSHDLRERVAESYRAVLGAVRGSRTPHVARMWNFIPGITDPLGVSNGHPALERYMAFNEGRFEGFDAVFGSVSGFMHLLPTATGIGHRGRDLVIHALGVLTPVRPLENPRQRPAYRYSERYGPRPPCFARAAAAEIGGSAALLIGGTASILGEDSLHIGDFDAQFEETLVNLRAVVEAAGGHERGRDPLVSITHARVYCVREGDVESAAERLAPLAAPGARIERCRADLCRRDLLVEIEAVAALVPA